MNMEQEYAELCRKAEVARQNALDSFLWRGGIPDARKDQDAVTDWARAYGMAVVAFANFSERERDQLVRLHYARRSCLLRFSGKLKSSEAEIVAAENHFCRCRDTVLASLGARLTPLQRYVLDREFLSMSFD
jgi:hypothetical protein